MSLFFKFKTFPPAFAIFMLAGLLLFPSGAEAASPASAKTPPVLALPDTPPRERRADRILAMPRSSPGSLRQRAARERIGARVHRRFPSADGLEVLKIPATLPVELAIAELRASGAYEYVEPDYLVRASGIPNDPQFGNLWGMHNTGQSGGLLDADIDAPEGWELRTSSDSVIVGVIDSGVRYTHEDLAANMWVNPGEIPDNGIDDDNNGYIDDVHGINAITGSGDPMDDNGHGTHVAGTIGAVGNNALGVAGIAWTTRLMALKFLGADGSGYLSDAIECIEYARAHGAQVTNNSWGGGGYSQALRDAIRAAGAAGSVFVAAAGNESNNNSANPSYPASYLVSNILAVGGFARNGSLYSSTNYGFGVVDLAAPAVSVFSTYHTSISAYTWMTGTSMATPHVSGIAALVRAHFPGESPRQTIHRIQRAVEIVEAWRGKFTFPGRVNLRMALEGTSSAPPNDNFADAIEIPAGGGRVRASLEGATIEEGETPLPGTTDEGTLWWKWTPENDMRVVLSTHQSEVDTVLAVFTGGSLSELSIAAGNDDSSYGATSELSLDVESGRTYWIALAGRGAGLVELRLSTASTAPGPENDFFADRIALTGSALLAYGTNENATREPGEPLNTSDSGGHTVWWEWTSPISGRVEILTEGSAYDTTLGVYSGGTVGELTPLDTNDDVVLGTLRTSRVLVDVTAGQKLQIQVDGWDTETGSIQLWLFAEPPPPNDDFINATALPSMTVNATGASVTTYGETYYALRETGEPWHSWYGHSSIWWKWTAPVSGNVTINLDGSDFYTLLGVYEGSSLGTLTGVASDSADSVHARVSFPAIAGHTYRIAVDGVERSAGFVTLNFAIQNARPGMSAPTLSPSGTAFSDEEIVPANLDATDPENDPVSYSVQWQFSTDGVIYQDAVGENSIVLSPNATRSGKWWRCRIVPSDALGPGEPVFSDSVIVDNRPPSTARVGSAFSYDCNLPGSALFEIAPGVVLPPGLLLNSRTGILYGTPEAGAEGLHTIRLLRGGLAREFDLLIGSAEGIYRVPAGREWTPTGPVQIVGILVVEGSIVGDQPIQIEQTYSAWSLLHFGLISTPQDAFDSDGDGVSDFAEFAFGGNPAKADSLPEPPNVEVAGQNAAIRFAKQKDPSLVEYVVERSNNLAEWTPLPDAPVVSTTSVDHATEIIKVRDTNPIGESPVFLRVRATMK